MPWLRRRVWDKNDWLAGVYFGVQWLVMMQLHTAYPARERKGLSLRSTYRIVSSTQPRIALLHSSERGSYITMGRSRQFRCGQTVFTTSPNPIWANGVLQFSWWGFPIFVTNKNHGTKDGSYGVIAEYMKSPEPMLSTTILWSNDRLRGLAWEGRLSFEKTFRGAMGSVL